MRNLITVKLLGIMLLTASCADSDSNYISPDGQIVLDGEKSPSEQYREQKEYEDRQRDIYRTLRP